MSDRESQQASLDASEASLPAENGSREVANDPPPLGRAEESVIITISLFLVILLAEQLSFS